MKRYFIQTEYTPVDLANAVNKSLAEGWECIGGVTAVTRHWGDGDVKDIQYCQAMIWHNDITRAN